MTSAGNFAMLGGGRSVPSLPYDAEVEYLGVGATIGPYIDTGYRWTTDNIKIDIEFMRAGGPAANTGLFGSQKVGRDTNWGIQFWQPNGTNVQHFVGSSGNVYNWNPTIGQKIHFVGEASASHTWKITIDGVEHAGSWVGTACQDVTTIGLFTLYNNSNMTARRTNNVNVYSFKLTDDGVLVIDMIPVRFTNELGQSEGAMYDRIGVGGMNPDGSPRNDGLYRNRGTGSFTIGPDIGSYVETDGKCWYNTGLYLRTPLIIECDYYLPGRGPGQSVWGAVVKSDARIQQQSSTSTTRREITFSYNDSHILVGSSDARPYYPYRAKAVFDVREGYQKVTTDFAEATASIELGLGESMTAPCCLFAYGRTNSPAIGFAPSKSRIYSWKCSMGGVLVADAVPSLGPDGSTPCFYDKVSKTYWYNMGTGTPKAVIV